MLHDLRQQEYADKRWLQAGGLIGGAKQWPYRIFYARVIQFGKALDL